MEPAINKIIERVHSREGAVVGNLGPDAPNVNAAPAAVRAAVGAGR
jgi:hypothetical protein